MVPVTAAGARGASALRTATAAMGTRFELIIEADDAERFRPAAEEAMACIEECHRLHSRFSPDSLVSYVNREASRRPIRIDADTWQLLRDALEVERGSGGAFAIVAHGSRPPSSSALTLDSAMDTVRLASGVSIDVGGIAKGHAIDLAVRGLRANGVTRALLHGGTSSVAAIGAPAGAPGWRIAIGSGSDAPVVCLRDRCLSVSSAAASDGDGSARIVDRRTGLSVRRAAHAWVTGPRCAVTDAWATAVVVLGDVPTTLPPEYDARIRDVLA